MVRTNETLISNETFIENLLLPFIDASQPPPYGILYGLLKLDPSNDEWLGHLVGKINSEFDPTNTDTDTAIDIFHYLYMTDKDLFNTVIAQINDQYAYLIKLLVIKKFI